MILKTSNIVAAGAVAFIWSATSGPAHATYLGYANGDPGPWDFYQQQHNGASPPKENTASNTPYVRTHHLAHFENGGYMGLGGPRPVSRATKPTSGY